MKCTKVLNLAAANPETSSSEVISRDTQEMTQHFSSIKGTKALLFSASTGYFAL